MGIVTIFSASFCRENEISKKLAAKLGFELLDEKLIEETKKQFHISDQKLRDTLNGRTPFLNNLTHDKEKNIAYLKAVLTQLVSVDNVIYHGFASHLLPNSITHILKVCILAKYEYRLHTAVEQTNLSEHEAKQQLRKDDENRYKWVQSLHQLSPWDEKLYDIIIPMHASSVDKAVNLIIENIQKPALQTTPESRKALDDFLFSAKVNVPLVENGYDVTIKNDSGNITIYLKEYVIRLKLIKEKIIKIVRSVEGVKNIEIIMARDVRVPVI